ncbi:amidohydrolase family protein [Nostoc sp. C117]|uniref:amidohydrolase family protein n=1 Tax=Nostoc sp. C117 TaxID=3349875 RepID=UPI00370D9129
MSNQTSGRIDVHHHFLPKFYVEALKQVGLSPPDGMSFIPEWSETKVLAMLDQLGIGTAFLSISSPGVHFGDDDAARSLARRTNQEAARLTKAHPGRFGFFAITPLPDVEGALEEIRYAFDMLEADGVVFQSNFRGTYLGDDLLIPIYEELNKRRAVIFLHPTGSNCQCSASTSTGEHPRDIALGYPVPLIEFIFETTRTITHMMLSGTLARYPNLRVIVPHAGAALPVLAGRIERIIKAGAPVGKDAPQDIRVALRALHYDLAGVPVPEALSVLLQIADPKKLHYGSDYPFTPLQECEQLLKQLNETPLLSSELREAAMTANAYSLFSQRLSVSIPRPQHG